MKPETIIIHRPDIDFTTFLGVALKVLGRSLSAAADSSHKQMSVATRYLSCLSAMHSSEVVNELNPKLLPHVSVSIFIVADEADIFDILECSAGIPFVTAETTLRGVLAAVLTGNLAQWKAAVMAGACPETEPIVRYAFNQIHGLFCGENINLWTDCRQKPSTDGVTYLLEDKRGR